jgi:hypothetical protein
VLRSRLPPSWRTYLVGAAVILGLFALLWWAFGIQAFWAVLGIVVGVGVAGFWAPASARRRPRPPGPQVAPQPFAPLGRTALPLTLPLLIFLVAGTIKVPELGQFAAGVLAGLLAWIAIVRPELGRLTVRLCILSAAGALVAAALIAGVIDLFGDEPILGSFEDRGGLSATVLRVAVILWAAAIVIRLASFATSWLRLLETAALAASVWCLAAWAGVIGAAPGADGLEPAGVLALVAGGLLLAEAVAGAVAVVTGTVEPVRKWTAETGALPTRWADGVAGAGLTVALVATIALGAAAVIGLDETSSEGHGHVTAGGEPITPEQPAMAPQEQLRAQGSPDGLVATYMPELAFRHDQLWLPESVDSYVADATLQGPRGESVEVDSLDDLPGPDDCPGLTPLPCYRLTINCPTAADVDCSRAHEVGFQPLDDPDESGAVYVRTVRQPQKPGLFPEGVGTFGGQRPWMLLEYWYFYPYDEWTSPVVSGDLVQRHEGDWEAVIVGLSKREPLFVGYSQHCGGEWRPWATIEVAEARAGEPRTHPLIAVANGSQANYVRAGQGESPDWAGCSGTLPSGAVTLLSYASNIRDRTGYEYGWIPPAGGVISAGVGKAPMSFPGYWGGTNAVTKLENAREHTLATGGAPKTPSMQPLWVRPLNTVFCSNWGYPQHTPSKCHPPE